MPTKFWRYGRASDDKQVLTPEVQADRTLLEYQHQLATGQIPPDTIDAGFIVDKDTSRSVHFLDRNGAQHIIANAVKGDRICVAAYDRMIGSPVDCALTLRWSLESGVDLVLMDLRVDTSTNHGRMIAHIIAAVKENEVLELRRRTREALAYRRKNGRPAGPPPIGYQVKTIMGIDGQKRKWFFPYPKEREYCRMIAYLHEDLGMSMRAIVAKFCKENYCKPRSGKPPRQFSDVATFLRAYKKGYPLKNGAQWKAPDFRFNIVENDEVIDLIADCA